MADRTPGQQGPGRPGHPPADHGPTGELLLAHASDLLAAAGLILGDRDAAEDVVLRTLLRGATAPDPLEDADRLRIRLVMILREEAHDGHRRAVPPPPTPTPDDDISRELAGLPEPDHRLTRGDLVQLVREAAAGLQDRDRELLELHLYAGLDATDLGTALGADDRQAAGLLRRLRTHTEQAVGALLVARHGRRGCARLDDVLADWDGYYDAGVRALVTRHAATCGKCRRHWTSALTFDQLAAAVWQIPPSEELRRRVEAGLRTPPTEVPADMPHPAAEPPPRPGAGGRTLAPRRLRSALVAAAAAVVVTGIVLAVLVGGGGPASVSVEPDPVGRVAAEQPAGPGATSAGVPPVVPSSLPATSAMSPAPPSSASRTGSPATANRGSPVGAGTRRFARPAPAPADAETLTSTTTPSSTSTSAGSPGTSTPAGSPGSSTPAGSPGSSTPAGSPDTSTPAGSPDTSTPTTPATSGATSAPIGPVATPTTAAGSTGADPTSEAIPAQSDRSRGRPATVGPPTQAGGPRTSGTGQGPRP